MVEQSPHWAGAAGAASGGGDAVADPWDEGR